MGAKGWATDRVAALLSNLCLMHCLALPLAALLPTGLLMGGISVHALHGPHWLHWGLLLLALPVSLLALCHGWRAHGRKLPLLLALPGFALMGAGASLHGAGWLESVLTVAGGLVIALAHWRNVALWQRG